METISIFQFRLRPAEDIQPWGDPPRLHYYGLTDGCYWMRVGEDELFRYTPEVLACWKSEAHEQGRHYDTFGEPYDAYQVKRLDEDLGEMLPYALEPVPPEVAVHVDAVDAWRRAVGTGPVPEEIIRALAAKEGREYSAAEEMFYAATEWWGNRQMPVMHLRFSPVVHIWSHGDEVEIRWDNRKHLYNGIPVWTAQVGKCRLSRTSFIQAVQDFRQRFVSQMGERVQNVCRNWSRPDITIDLEQLKRDQGEMEDGLRHGCPSVMAGTDWKAVRSTLERIKDQSHS